VGTFYWCVDSACFHSLREGDDDWERSRRVAACRDKRSGEETERYSSFRGAKAGCRPAAEQTGGKRLVEYMRWMETCLISCVLE
jgi:hypothetical protein